jgi:methylmalonyl-CoA/ethylmalonyl-CoA epimerase
MIDVVRIDHISMAVRELEPQIELLERVFGFRYRGRFQQPGYVGAELDIPGGAGITWEVLAPDGPDSYLHRFLDGENGPGLHHLALQINDMPQAIQHMESLGIEPWGYEPRGARSAESGAPPSAGGEAFEDVPDDGSDDGASVVYIHPRSGGAGFLFQLTEGAAWSPPEPFEDERSNGLGITGVSALGHAHHSRQQLGDWYEALFGFRTVHNSAISLGGPSFSSRLIETPRDQLGIEVMQPTHEDSFLQRFIDRRGSAIHHVMFQVRDVDNAVRTAERNGIRALGRQSGTSDGATWDEVFLAPEGTGGLLAGLFSWREEPPAPIPAFEPAPQPE